MEFKRHGFCSGFILTHRYKLGLSEFDIEINHNTADLGGDLANIDVDCYEKKMVITFSPLMNKANDSAIRKVLIHELIHGLHAMYKYEAKQCCSAEAYEHFEEQFINQMTRMIDGLI